jgi:hypothetical protein
MHTASEEYTRRTMQLGHYDTLGTVDDESAIVGHIGNGAQEYVLNYSVEVLMVGVGAIEFQLCLEGHAVCQSTFQTLFDGIARRVDIIVQEFQHEIVTRIRDGEVLREDLVQAVVLAKLGRSIQLEEILERLQLHFQEIGIGHRILYGSKINSLINSI